MTEAAAKRMREVIYIIARNVRNKVPSRYKGTGRQRTVHECRRAHGCEEGGQAGGRHRLRRADRPTINDGESFDAVTGRGLSIVEVVSKAWGSELLRARRRVWAEVVSASI